MRCILCTGVGFLTRFELVWQVKTTTSEGGASRKIFRRATTVVKSVGLVNTFHLPTRKCWGNRAKLWSFGLLTHVCRPFWLVYADFFGSYVQIFLARMCRLFWLVCADFLASCAQTFLARMCRLFWLVCADCFCSYVQTFLARVRRLFWLVCAEFLICFSNWFTLFVLPLFFSFKENVRRNPKPLYKSFKRLSLLQALLAQKLNQLPPL